MKALIRIRANHFLAIIVLLLLIIAIVGITTNQQTYILAGQLIVSFFLACILFRQTEILEQQTQLTEVDKKPLVQIGPSKSVGSPGSYEITNLSKYPVQVLEVLADGEPVKLISNIIGVDKSESVFGIKPDAKTIIVKVANLLNREICLEIKYDINEGRLKEVKPCSNIRSTNSGGGNLSFEENQLKIAKLAGLFIVAMFFLLMGLAALLMKKEFWEVWSFNIAGLVIAILAALLIK